MLMESAPEIATRKLQEREETVSRRSSALSRQSSNCSNCKSNHSYKYNYKKNGSRRRSLSYEYLKNQEDKCAKVGCKRCQRRGIMHSTSVSKEVQMLLNMSKSSFFGSGEIIPEVEGDDANSQKILKIVRRRKSVSYEQLNYDSMKSNDFYSFPAKVSPKQKREKASGEQQKTRDRSPKAVRLANSRSPKKSPAYASLNARSRSPIKDRSIKRNWPISPKSPVSPNLAATEQPAAYLAFAPSPQ